MCKFSELNDVYAVKLRGERAWRRKRFPALLYWREEENKEKE